MAACELVRHEIRAPALALGLGQRGYDAQVALSGYKGHEIESQRPQSRTSTRATSVIPQSTSAISIWLPVWT